MTPFDVIPEGVQGISVATRGIVLADGSIFSPENIRYLDPHTELRGTLICIPYKHYDERWRFVLGHTNGESSVGFLTYYGSKQQAGIIFQFLNDEDMIMFKMKLPE